MHILEAGNVVTQVVIKEPVGPVGVVSANVGVVGQHCTADYYSEHKADYHQIGGKDDLKDQRLAVPFCEGNPIRGFVSRDFASSGE